MIKNSHKIIIDFPLLAVDRYKIEILKTLRILYLTCSYDWSHQIVAKIKKSEATHEGHVTMKVQKLKFKKRRDSFTDDWLMKINFTYQYWISFQIFDVRVDSDFQILIAF